MIIEAVIFLTAKFLNKNFQRDTAYKASTSRSVLRGSLGDSRARKGATTQRALFSYLLLRFLHTSVSENTISLKISEGFAMTNKFKESLLTKMVKMEGGEMAQVLRALVALRRTQVQDSVPHGAYIPHNRGFKTLLGPPQAPRMYHTHTNKHIQSKTLIFTEKQQTSSRITKLVLQIEVNSGRTLGIPIWVRNTNLGKYNKLYLSSSWHS